MIMAMIVLMIVAMFLTMIVGMIVAMMYWQHKMPIRQRIEALHSEYRLL